MRTSKEMDGRGIGGRPKERWMDLLWEDLAEKKA